MTRPRHYRLRRRLRLRMPCLTLFLLTLALLFDSTGTVRTGLCCAALHECGHIGAYAFLWHRLPLLELSPFGICLRLRGQPMTRREQLVLSAAGPLANFLCAALTLFSMEKFSCWSFFGYRFAACHLLVGAVNLLPLPPLDGANIAAAVLPHRLLFLLQSGTIGVSNSLGRLSLWRNFPPNSKRR